MIIEDESMMSNTVSKRFNDDWLVVEPPLWKILVDWEDYSRYMEK